MGVKCGWAVVFGWILCRLFMTIIFRGEVGVWLIFVMSDDNVIFKLRNFTGMSQEYWCDGCGLL